MNQKGLPPPGAAIDADLAAHRLDELLGNRKAKTGAAEFAGMGRIGLHEFLEDLFALLQAARRRPCRALRSAGSGARGALRPVRIDAHAAFVGELDRVADEIGQDLAQPQSSPRIAARQSASRRRRRSRCPCMGARPRSSTTPSTSCAQVDLVVLKRQRAGFDLGEIENVVDQRQKGLRPTA